MPAANQAAAAAAPAAQDAGWQGQAKTVARSLATFMLIQFAMKQGMSYFGINQGSPAPPVPATTDTAAGESVAANPAAVAQGTKPALPATQAWPLGTPMSMLLYVNTAEETQGIDAANPNVIWEGLTYGNWKDVREEDLILEVPESVRAHNGSWWMDILLLKDGGVSPVGRPTEDIAVHRKELTRWMPKRRIRKEKSLLGSKDEHRDEDEVEKVLEADEPAPAKEIVSHWSPNLTITVIGDVGTLDMNSAPAQVAPYYHLGPNTTDGKATYNPVIFPNDFWLLKENMREINETTKELPLRVTYHAISSMKFNIFAGLTVSFDQAAQQQGSGAELDEVKRMLTETNPFLLVTTALVTVLHMLFEFLAFSSDVNHWRKKGKDENLVGVSLRTILTNVVVQLIVLLYLQDSSEETSMMILFTQGIGLLIEAWKITKVVDVRVREAPGQLIPYKITFEDKHELSEDEKKTQEYDRLAFKIVSWGATPFLLAYAGYSLKYKTHRSWYSFIITTLAQSVYMFGFVQLIPQLIINYKLKSVAHMPMKAMVYKTLGTVVDDFFAFCVKMPWLHRLACFRDDVVFLILLYQRWIYRIDYSRVNEYGQQADDADKAAAVDVIEEVVDEKTAKGSKAAVKETKKNK